MAGHQTGTGNGLEPGSIWLPRGSIKPIWLAASITMSLGGLFAFWPFLVAGLISSLWISWRWIADARVETNELPRN